MASEKELELLEQYLTNKLGPAEREAFEQKLKGDPGLSQEFDFQNEIIRGVRDARIAELKATLSQVPVPPLSGTESLFTGKTITWLVVAGVATVSIVYYLNRPAAPTIAPQENPAQEEVVPQTTPEEELSTTPKEQVESSADEPIAGEDNRTSSPPAERPSGSQEKTNRTPKSTDPVIDVFDPTKEMNAAEDEAIPGDSDKGVSNTKVNPSPGITVETESGNRKYDFHYQFNEGKLILYGEFEKDLYEILEFFSESQRTIFLYYKADYFYLDEKNTKPTPLTAVKDPKLLKKLRESREGGK